MARRTKLNPDGTAFQIGSSVRLERGLKPREDGSLDRDCEPIWIVFQKKDVTDDPDTTYSYRYEEVAHFAEKELGECPDRAFERADALAGEEA